MDSYLDEFKQFNPINHMIGDRPFSCILFGKSGSGKTYLMLDLFFRIKSTFDNIYLFSGTIDVRQLFGKYIGTRFTFGGLDDEDALSKLQELIERQTILRERRARLPRILILFDDIITGGNDQRNPILNQLFTNHKHYNISMIVATQYIKAIQPTVRQNTDFAVLFRQINDEAIRTLSNEFLGVFPRQVRSQLLFNLTNNHQVIVVENKGNIDYYIYKASKSIQGLLGNIIPSRIVARPNPYRN